MLKKYINLLRPKVEKIFESDSSGHDISHLERTMRNALFLQKYEGGDKVVIGVSSFLHDIHRIMQNKNNRYFTPEESLPLINKLLKEIGFPKDKKDKVLHCIKYHEVYNWQDKAKQVSDIESLILQDADNLDAIGAIGIARTMIYIGAHGIMMHNPNIPIEKNGNFDDENNYGESFIHHFYNNLYRLEKNMNTKTAKNLAHKKTIFMKKFVDEFLKEWDGKEKNMKNLKMFDTLKTKIKIKTHRKKANSFTKKQNIFNINEKKFRKEQNIFNINEKKFRKELYEYLKTNDFYRINRSDEDEALSKFYQNYEFYGSPKLQRLFEAKISPSHKEIFPTMSIEEYEKRILIRNKTKQKNH